MKHNDPFLAALTKHVALLADSEPKFGAAAALLRYGQEFEPKGELPSWIQRGAPKECFANTARALLARIGSGRRDIRYAEGYAVDRVGIPLPIQHAWLVDVNGFAIDPTWSDGADHLYFGIAFKTDFILAMLRQTNGECGLLVNPPLMRRHFGSAELFEAAIG
ncbi:hypothetical protein [Mesorhizobium sp. ANAO-SY3R2]|uniref:hypothetical protein n=1 Tax=Mesorhizobium sp. ANAO-SY3R2 TaxID=3166644 RepID=UPI0036726514